MGQGSAHHSCCVQPEGYNNTPVETVVIIGFAEVHSSSCLPQTADTKLGFRHEASDLLATITSDEYVFDWRGETSKETLARLHASLSGAGA